MNVLIPRYCTRLLHQHAVYANGICRISVKESFRRNSDDLSHVLLDHFHFTTKLFQKITVNLCFLYQLLHYHLLLGIILIFNIVKLFSGRSLLLGVASFICTLGYFHSSLQYQKYMENILLGKPQTVILQLLLCAKKKHGRQSRLSKGTHLDWHILLLAAH